MLLNIYRYLPKDQIKGRLICHVWFWPYMVRQSTKLSLYMVHQSINKCWASVPPQYHPSGPWGSLDQSQTWFTERKPVKKSRKTANKIFAKKNIFLSFRKNFITLFICELGPSSQRWRVGMLSGHLWKDQKFNEHWYIGGFRAHLPSPVICHVQRGSFS